MYSYVISIFQSGRDKNDTDKTDKEWILFLFFYFFIFISVERYDRLLAGIIGLRKIRFSRLNSSL